ncbi:MAG: FliM/FliN family flagellar motor switch protein [Gemmatimonadota bacterium]|nr:FliM/FliN family flagellar motor switch protein [Gemmatimonadota bacterium]MDH5758230.1 FliM/FliN family flagellar motor switch protein [Gemmatimonadota bacterium]
MSNESLSQNEIDLLFSGGAPAAQEARSPSRGIPEVQLYDFRRPARISKERKRSLTAMYGLLAKSLEGWITTRVRDQVELELQSVEQLTFGEFMLALPSPCASYIIDVGTSGQQGVIDFGHEFAYFLVDRLLGGTGRHGVPDRPLSLMEKKFVEVVAERATYHLMEVWADYVQMDLQITSFESIPEMLQAANREDPVLVANIEAHTGDSSSLFLVCLPFVTVEKFFTGASKRRTQNLLGTPEERAHDRDQLEESVRDARITVGARFPAFHATLGTLASLAPGGVLETGLSPNARLDLFVAGQRRFQGTPGRMGNSLAVRVTDHVDPEPEDLIEAGRENDH